MSVISILQLMPKKSLCNKRFLKPYLKQKLKQNHTYNIVSVIQVFENQLQEELKMCCVRISSSALFMFFGVDFQAVIKR